MQVAKDEETVLSWTVSTSGRRNGKFTNPYCPVASPYAGKRRGSQPKHSIRKPQIQKWAREQPSRTRKGYVSMICGYIQHSLMRQDRVAHLDESPSCNLNSTTGAGSRGHLEAFAAARSERDLYLCWTKTYAYRFLPFQQFGNPWVFEVLSSRTTGCCAQALLVRRLVEKICSASLTTCPGRTSEVLAFS